MAPRTTKRRPERRRGTKGDGSVLNIPNGSDNWFFRPPPINGVQQHRIPAESKEAAQEMQRKHRRDREDGIIGGRGYTVKTWMPVYFQATADQGTAKDSTVEGYEQKDRLYISPHLGSIVIRDLTTARVRQWFARDLVGTDGKLLSFNTRKNCFALLRAALNLAVAEDLFRKNPCDGVKIVRPEDEDEYRGYAFNPGECARLLAAAEGYWNYAIVYAALATGMRECELIGLRWNNVTLAGSRPHIRVIEQYKIVRGKGRWKSTKNRQCRDIDIDDALLSVLKNQWDQLQARRHDPAFRWVEVDHNLVFPSEVGTPLNERNLVRSYKAMLGRADLPDATFHDLRHTAGSLMLMAGARMTEVSEVLGHSSVKVTQDIYAHAFPETRREAVTGLSRLLQRTGGA